MCTIKEIRDFFQDKENVPCPMTERLVKEGYQQTSGGYITIARRAGMLVDYRQNQPSQYWHLMNYCNGTDPDKKFPRSIVCGELLFWMAEVSESITKDGLMFLMAKILSSATDNGKGRPVYDRDKWNDEIHKLCFDAILNNVKHNGEAKCHDNPYFVVREEVSETMDGEERHVETVGFDFKGRKVAVTHEIFKPDGSHGVMSKAVSADGYWYGGITETDAEGNYTNGCQMAAYPFDENEKE